MLVTGNARQMLVCVGYFFLMFEYLQLEIKRSVSKQGIESKKIKTVKKSDVSVV